MEKTRGGWRGDMENNLCPDSAPLEEARLYHIRYSFTPTLKCLDCFSQWHKIKTFNRNDTSKFESVKFSFLLRLVLCKARLSQMRAARWASSAWHNCPYFVVFSRWCGINAVLPCDISCYYSLAKIFPQLRWRRVSKSPLWLKVNLSWIF